MIRWSIIIKYFQNAPHPVWKQPVSKQWAFNRCKAMQRLIRYSALPKRSPVQLYSTHNGPCAVRLGIGQGRIFLYNADPKWLRFLFELITLFISLAFKKCPSAWLLYCAASLVFASFDFTALYFNLCRPASLGNFNVERRLTLIVMCFEGALRARGGNEKMHTYEMRAGYQNVLYKLINSVIYRTVRSMLPIIFLPDICIRHSPSSAVTELLRHMSVCFVPSIWALFYVARIVPRQRPLVKTSCWWCWSSAFAKLSLFRLHIITLHARTLTYNSKLQPRGITHEDKQCA